MEPMAKKLLKASLGNDDLQYMKVETECVVATNEHILIEPIKTFLTKYLNNY